MSCYLSPLGDLQSSGFEVWQREHGLDWLRAQGEVSLLGFLFFRLPVLPQWIDLQLGSSGFPSLNLINGFSSRDS